MAIHEFGPFRYDDEQRELSRGGEPVPLQPKTFETFAALFARRGQIVEKAELMRLVWPDTIVEETGLARNISQLRKALGEEAEEYIETIPKRGYRFRAAPETAAKVGEPERTPRRVLIASLVLLGVAAAGAGLWWQFYRPSAYVPLADLTLAVIPFEERSPELRREQFAAGLADVLTASLSRLERTNVIATSVIRRYQEKQVPVPVMTRLLRVDAVVEGSAQLENGTLRASVRITDVRSGRVIWSEVVEQPSVSLLTAQSGIAEAVARGARASLR